MEILITNDDGWGSKGILTLARVMSQIGHVTVLAPQTPQSGQSNAISVEKPMYLRAVQDPLWGKEEWQKQVDVWTMNGTPSDCVKMAVNVLYEGDGSRIDLVVSGINHGHNGSVNLIYSGTMGACFVAAEHKIKAIGFSLNDHLPDADFSVFEPYILSLTKDLICRPYVEGICYNVNAPKGKIAGVKWTRQCHGHWSKEMEARQDEKGNTYYWLVGSFINHEPMATDTDIWALEHGYISIQPCSIDMTAYGQMG